MADCDEHEERFGDYQILTDFTEAEKLFSVSIVSEKFMNADLSIQEEVLRSTFYELISFAASKKELHQALDEEIANYLGIEPKPSKVKH